MPDGLSITGDVFNISIKDLAVLYEYWCFIKLNSLMKDRYELVSQDIVKVQGNGLYVSLVKGSRSRVKYRNPAKQCILTTTLKAEEHGKYCGMEGVTAIDYTSHRSNKLLSPEYLPEFRTILDRLRIQI